MGAVVGYTFTQVLNELGEWQDRRKFLQLTPGPHVEFQGEWRQIQTAGWSCHWPATPRVPSDLCCRDRYLGHATLSPVPTPLLQRCHHILATPHSRSQCGFDTSLVDSDRKTFLNPSYLARVSPCNTEEGIFYTISVLSGWHCPSKWLWHLESTRLPCLVRCSWGEL